MKAPLRTRGAFTLLELLLSMALTVVLLGVLFTALDLHWRFSLSGQEEVTRSQIARSIFNRLSHDIRSTIYRKKPAAASTSNSSSTSSSENSGTSTTSGTGTQQSGNTQSTGTSGGTGQTGNQNTNQSGSTSGTQSTSQTPTEPMLLSDAYSGSALGIFGDADSIVMHVLRPDRRSRGTADVAGNPYSSSDLKSVSYFLGGSTSSIAMMFGTSSGASGLTRTSADRLSLSMAGTNTDLVTAASKTEQLAPEIESISFSYFDGAEWLTAWDSEVEGRLPNAVGVAITFKSPSDSMSSFVRRQASEMTDTFRIVITLPAANSFEGMSL